MGTKVEVLRVFTDEHGEFGNELGVVEAATVRPADRQHLATALGFSETVFVDEPADGSARVQIFTPAVELPFAGHPTVGTAWWLAQRGTPVDALDVAAGRVLVTNGAVVQVQAHADWAPHFTFHDLVAPADVDALDPDSFTSGHHYAWAWSGDGTIRSRMFAPDMGIREDEATGAAAVRMTARLTRDLTITQGAGSQIVTSFDGDGWVRIGGRTVADRVLDV